MKKNTPISTSTLLLLLYFMNLIQGRIPNTTTTTINTFTLFNDADNDNNNNETYVGVCRLDGPTPDSISNCWDFTLPIFLNDITEVTYSQQGCDNSECQELVCACDPYCCGTLWDLSCRGYPDNRFVPGCSAHYLCCEKKNVVAEIHTNTNEECDCFRKRIPIL